MASLNIGKPEAVNWIKNHFERGSTCLDVGACDGKWSDLVGDYLKMDAVEVFAPNITNHKLMDKYDVIYACDVRELAYGNYNLIIFGDVLEHMSVEDAQKVLAYAWDRCDDLLVAVPYMWVNRSHYGNPYEVHIQDDLTPENVRERYPGLKALYITPKYGYYTKGGK